MSDPAPRDWRVRAPLIATLLAIFALAVLVCWYFLLTFTVALAAALMLAGPHARITRRLAGRKGVAAGVLLTGCALALLLPLLAYAAVFAHQASAFAEWAEPRLTPEAVDTLWNVTLPAQHPAAMKLAQRLLGGAGIRGGTEAMAALSAPLQRFAQTVFVEGASALMDTVVLLMLVFYLLRDGDELRGVVRGVSPFTRGQETEVLYHLNQTVKGVFLSLILVPLAQGAAALPGFWALGLPSPVIWSVAVFFAALVPIVGSPLVWVPAGLYLIAVGSLGRGLGLLVYGGLVIASVDNILKPFILRQTAQVHTMLGFVFVLGGLYAFGAKGIVAGPVVLSLVISAYRIYRYDVLRWDEKKPALTP